MVSYQGRALDVSPRGSRAPRGRRSRLLRVLLGLGLATVIAHLPWSEVRKRFAVVRSVGVEGVRYLDAARVQNIAGITVGQDLFEVDAARARQALLLHPRIERAEVARRGPRAFRIAIVERLPVLLVHHGGPWELDSAGVLLAPLMPGVVSDVPLLTGARFDDVPEGARLSTPPVARGLAWVRALSVRQLQLQSQVSEVDVSAPRETGLLLLDGTRVVGEAWPPATRTLSALRVVLADLKRRGLAAHAVDLRFQGQVIVRPVLPAGVPALRAGPAAAPDSSRTVEGA